MPPQSAPCSCASTCAFSSACCSASSAGLTISAPCGVLHANSKFNGENESSCSCVRAEQEVAQNFGYHPELQYSSRRSPADGTPGARMLPPSCSCTRRICRSFALTRRRQRTSPLMIARPSSSAAGTPGSTTMRVVSLTAELSLRATTGAPSPTTSLSQAGSAGMECRRRRARHRRPPGTSPNKVLSATMTQPRLTTRTPTSESPNLSTVILV